MILECPDCRTRYLVPDSAIGVEGRTVRCASCRHSWFQHASETMLEPTPDPPAPPRSEAASSEPAPPEPFRPAPAPQPRPVPVPATIADVPVAVAPPPVLAEPAIATDYDALPPRPPLRARRNPARRWTLLAITAGVLMLLAAGAILWSGTPELLRRIGLPIGPEESPLRLVDNPIERRELPNGSQLFAVSGKVLNPSSSRQRVPDIRADLRDAQGRRVFSWTITPEQRTLGPKSAIDFNSAKLDVPATSRQLELSFAGGEASGAGEGALPAQ